jgi:hypothetical protein
MVWGAICKEGRSKLVIMVRDPSSKRSGYTSNSYIEALTSGLLPDYTGTRHFQQDNARIHISKATTAFLLEHRISLIDWPPHSPDLNPIKHVWARLKRDLYKKFPWVSKLKKNAEDIEKFKACLVATWDAIPQDFIRGLMESMPRRVETCRKAKGWYTKY